MYVQLLLETVCGRFVDHPDIRASYTAPRMGDYHRNKSAPAQPSSNGWKPKRSLRSLARSLSAAAAACVGTIILPSLLACSYVHAFEQRRRRAALKLCSKKPISWRGEVGPTAYARGQFMN